MPQIEKFGKRLIKFGAKFILFAAKFIPFEAKFIQFGAEMYEKFGAKLMFFATVLILDLKTGFSNRLFSKKSTLFERSNLLNFESTFLKEKYFFPPKRTLLQRKVLFLGGRIFEILKVLF